MSPPQPLLACDVLIVGGGPVGGCAAALLQQARLGRTPLDVALLEPSRPAPRAAAAPFEPRVAALARASERILRNAGAWSRIAPGRICAYERMRVWHESVGAQGSDVLVFDAADAGEPNLGYIAESREIQSALLDAFESAGGRIVPAAFENLRLGDGGIDVLTSAGTVRTRLLVGADGPRSAVRTAIGLSAERASYQQTAIVANVATARPHESTAWQRFLSTGTLAFLPLADGSSSIVWSADEAIASVLLAASPEEFAAELQRQSDDALGAVRLLTERIGVPLVRLTAQRYTANRCALIGDAAHVVHPLAGQGVNLGLLDAAALAQSLLEGRQAGEDPGALGVLRRYERWRRSEMAGITLAIDAFDRLLAHGSGPLARLAQRGLAWVNRSSAIKRVFIAHALGTAGELPRAART